MGYKTHSGRWDWQEIKFDISVYLALAVCVYLAVRFG